MKFCFTCKKEIDDSANFCPTCGTSMQKGIRKKWYFNSTSLVVSFLCIGPLMLPLVWFHPSFSKTKKIIYTVIILVLSYIIFLVFMKSMKSITDMYKFAGSM